jgi:hypothetical protein
MKPFALLVAYDVFEFLERLPREAQRALRGRLLQIRDFPHNHSDYAEPDDFDRRLEINICGKFAIKYRIDYSDRQVKVLDIHFADRRNKGG